ncbi:hypothetical protein [Leucobacter chromiiresistens]|nr:hypothetical protein [Leucobacter chromiiresistens]
MHIDEQIVPSGLRLGQVDVDECALLVDGASAGISDGFHAPSFLSE